MFAIPPQKAMTTFVVMKGYKQAPSMKSQRKNVAKCAPIKHSAKKLPAAVANRMGWLSRASIDDEDCPWDGTSMYVDADSMNQIAKRNHAQWVRDCRRRMNRAPANKPLSNVESEPTKTKRCADGGRRG